MQRCRLYSIDIIVSLGKRFCMCSKVKARQKAVSALETQVAELTQQLDESDQSRLQLEQHLKAQHSSSAADAAAVKVGWRVSTCLHVCSWSGC